MTPGDARDAGSDLVVVGRPLRDAEDPAAVARVIVNQLKPPMVIELGGSS